MPSSDVMEAAAQAHVRALTNADLSAVVAGGAAFTFSVAFFGPAKRAHA
jgi:hypothetical protein